MPILQGFPTAKQKTSDSCWACAVRMIINWFERNSDKPKYDSDEALAMAWSKSSNKSEDVEGSTDLDSHQSAAAALGDMGYSNYTFSTFIPEPGEIKADIDEGRPLLALVGTDEPQGTELDLEYKGGHWVVITGINDNGTEIEVFDPDDGVKKFIPYHKSKYEREGYETQYWQHTSYFELSDK